MVCTHQIRCVHANQIWFACRMTFRKIKKSTTSNLETFHRSTFFSAVTFLSNLQLKVNEFANQIYASSMQAKFGVQVMHTKGSRAAHLIWFACKPNLVCAEGLK